MPPEPDNQIDELLQAYAKKRREQLGAPLDVHPATRKLLQGEVARTFPIKPSAVKSWFFFLKMFWPRLPFAVSILLVLGIGSWSMFKSNRQDFAEQPTMKLSKLEPGDESRLRASEESLAAAKNTPLAEAEKKIELGLNEPAREIRSDRIEILELAPPIQLGRESGLAKEKASDKKVAIAAKATNQPTITLARRYALDKSELEKLNETVAPAQPKVVTAPKPQALSASRAEPAPDSVEPAKGKDIANITLQDETKRKLESRKPALTPAPTSDFEAGKKIAATSGGGFGGGGMTGAPAGLGGVGTPAVPLNLGGARSGNSQYDLDKFDRAPTDFYYFSPLNTSTNAPPNFVSPNNTLNSSYADGGYVLADPLLDRILAANQLAENRDLRRESFGLALGKFGEAESLRGETDQLAASLDAGGRLPGAVSQNQWSENTFRFQMTNQVALATTPVGSVSRQNSRGVRQQQTLKLPAQLPAKAEASPVESQAALAKLNDGAARVLNAFDVEQTGDRIRITEADGSVYEGQLAAPSTSAVVAGAERAARFKDVEPTEQKLQFGQSGNLVTQNANTSNLGGASISFQASGTNRSLNQVVVISGFLSGGSLSTDPKQNVAPVTQTFLSATVAPASAPAPTANGPVDANTVLRRRIGLPQQANSSVGGVVASWTQMQGRAIIGATNEIQINAMRVKP